MGTGPGRGSLVWVSGDNKLSHRPFARLPPELEQAVKERRGSDSAGGDPRPGPPARLASNKGAAKEADGTEGEDEDEDRLLAREMLGVRPLPGRDNFVAAERESAPPAPRSDEGEGMAQLADLVEGRTTFDYSSTDEYIEGIAAGLDRRLLRRLRLGHFAVQAHLDLHGRNRQEARPLVEQFLLQSRGLGRRCVLIVHGRGLNSKDQIPVLKESVRTWLCRGRIARFVLAFCSARPQDGGAGAVYVLLRK